jgi:hypothetical protein
MPKKTKTTTTEKKRSDDDDNYIFCFECDEKIDYCCNMKKNIYWKYSIERFKKISYKIFYGKKKFAADILTLGIKTEDEILPILECESEDFYDWLLENKENTIFSKSCFYHFLLLNL